MVRDTSIEVYHQIHDEGLLSNRRLQVWDCIFEHGPMTASQVFQKLNIKTNQSGRLTELAEMGVIRETHKGSCPVTGREVYFWKTTNVLPVKPKKITLKEQKEAVLQDIVTLGERLPMTYKGDLRKIYHKLKDL